MLTGAVPVAFCSSIVCLFIAVLIALKHGLLFSSRLKREYVTPTSLKMAFLRLRR
jgi:hypothetical protein